MQIPAEKPRISFLDGLRGLAILLVIFFHAYARYPELIPYGNTFAEFPFFKHGWLGVHLFFMISGFVIFMTLEKCSAFREFILRRWLRLFPAMLICSLIIFATASWLPERPRGELFFRDLFPGLLFFDPGAFNARSIEGAFWSLYVEVKFYLVFGILYFALGWRKAVITLVSLFCLSSLASALKLFVPGINVNFISKITGAVAGQFYGWFAAGIFHYKYFSEKNPRMRLYGIILAIAAALCESAWKPIDLSNYIQATVFALFVATIFSLSISNAKVQTVLSSPLLLFVGFISYPLYLIHENMMIALIIKIGHLVPPSLTALIPFIPLLPIFLIMNISWVITVYGETWLRKELRAKGRQLAILMNAKNT